MHHLLLLLPMAVLTCCMSRLFVETRKHRQWAKADRVRSDMFNKYMELCDDPVMTDQKWAEWVSVFRAVDEYYQANNPYNIPVNSLEQYARNQIDDQTFLGRR